MNWKRYLYRFIVLCIAPLALAACGSGGSDSPSPPAPPNPTITGLAATGAALASATVTAKCTSGASVSGITGADGTFSLELASGQTVPCLVQAKQGAVTLHGFAAAAEHINVTPLTDLVINRALGSDAAAAFASFDASKGAAITTGLVAAKAYVIAQVTPLTGAPSVDPLTGVFKIGDPDDKLLSNLQTALVAASKSLDDLRLAAVAGGSIVAVVTRQTWFFSDGAAVTASQVTSFGAQGLYYNVHSAANPGGEIRSQIIPASPGFVTDNGNPATSNNVSALLSGDQEVPAKTSKATGYATVVLDPVTKTLSGAVVTSGIVGSAAHIHDGLPGVAGPVIFPLVGGPTVWTVPAGTVLTDAQIATLHAGGYYVNVHSTGAPGGEIRGQLNEQLRFAALSGANEVPANTSTATGIAVLALNPTTNQVRGFVKTTGITATAAHFHQAAAGVNGGVIVPLTETPAGSGLWIVAPGQTLTAAQAGAFNADGVYANVHSAANPGGEIRGQVVTATVTIGNAALDGANEVPPKTTAASGTGVMALNSVTRQVQGNVKTTGIDATAAHVHAAAAGANGPVIVPLTLTPPPSTLQAPLAVSTTSLADGTVGSAYSLSLNATGGTAPYTWAVSTGALPAGLNLSAAGVISGTPTAAGTASFTVSATDSAAGAATATKALSINVTAAAAATVSFVGQVQPIFTASCLTGCHTTGGIAAFLNLSTAASSFAALVQSTPPRVIAGSSATSVLYGRVNGTLVPRMPLGLAPLSAADQTLIKDWIDQGAANN